MDKTFIGTAMDWTIFLACITTVLAGLFSWLKANDAKRFKVIEDRLKLAHEDIKSGQADRQRIHELLEDCLEREKAWKIQHQFLKDEIIRLDMQRDGLMSKIIGLQDEVTELRKSKGRR